MTCPEASIPDWSENTTMCPGGKVEKIKKEASIFIKSEHLFVLVVLGSRAL